MHNWFDTEWDYGFAKGLYGLIESASLLARFEPALLLPSHGPVVRQAAPSCRPTSETPSTGALYVRGYEIFTFASADQDKLSRPSDPAPLADDPAPVQIQGAGATRRTSPSLADSGRALLVDCGVIGQRSTRRSSMRERMGLKAIDAILVTHMHGDHFLDAPYMREKWGAKLWTLDRVAEKFEQPERFDYAALVPAYGPRGSSRSRSTACSAPAKSSRGRATSSAWTGCPARRNSAARSRAKSTAAAWLHRRQLVCRPRGPDAGRPRSRRARNSASWRKAISTPPNTCGG